MKILITGATGYFGRHLIPSILSLSENHEILTINRNPQKAIDLFPDIRCKHISSDHLESEIQAFSPDLVIHLATLSTSRFDDEIIDPIIEANISFGVKLLSALSKAQNLKCFINVGSFAEYRLGTDSIDDAYLYTATKSAFRTFLKFYADLSNFKYFTAVPYTVYGGDDKNKKIIDYIRESLNSNEAVGMTKGEQILDFIHVNDVIDFFIEVITNQESLNEINNGSNFYLGTGKGTTIKSLASIIENKYALKCNINWGAIPYRPLDVMNAIAPIEKNPRIKWKAKIDLEVGIDMFKQTNK